MYAKNSVEGFDPSAITAAILAGGAGARLAGRDKGLEVLAGRPLIAHVIEAMRGQTGALLICANRNIERYAGYAPTCTDAVAGFAGPLAGIAAALAACETEWLLTVPVDCPSPARDLASRLRAGVGAARAAVVHAERSEPLFALYRRGLAAHAAAALARNESVWRWQEEIGAVAIDFAEMHAFVNLNTTEDFRHWQERHRD